MTRAPLLLVVGIAALTLAAAAVLVAESRPPRAGKGRGEFQRLVGGLGFGPALDLAGGPFPFDPRLCGASPYDLEPIPAGRAFFPNHGFSVFPYRPLTPTGTPAETAEHAQVP